MRCLVFGASGQAGSYLVELLRSRGSEVVPVLRSQLDLADARPANVSSLLLHVAPDEIYNFAGRPRAAGSWDDPQGYWQVNVTVPLMMLECLARFEGLRRVRYFQAGSASMYDPDTPYGVAAQSVHGLVKDYREHYGLYACTGIFYNMESPRRATTFFAQKVCSEAVRIKRETERTGGHVKMRLGQLADVRDWGWAPEYVEAARMMLSREAPDDFVIATGVRASCKAFVMEALRLAGLGPEMEKYVDYDRTKGGRAMYAATSDVQRTSAALGWTATTAMSGVVRNLVKAYYEAASG